MKCFTKCQMQSLILFFLLSEEQIQHRKGPGFNNTKLKKLPEDD